MEGGHHNFSQLRMLSIPDCQLGTILTRARQRVIVSESAINRAQGAAAAACRPVLGPCRSWAACRPRSFCRRLPASHLFHRLYKIEEVCFRHPTDGSDTPKSRGNASSRNTCRDRNAAAPKTNRRYTPKARVHASSKNTCCDRNAATPKKNR